MTESFEQDQTVSSTTQNIQEELTDLKQQVKRLQSDLNLIQKRNLKVESNKGWETSLVRFICVSLITYITMNLILWTIGDPLPPVHAIIPTCGYIFSTLPLASVKKWWINSSDTGN